MTSRYKYLLVLLPFLVVVLLFELLPLLMLIIDSFGSDFDKEVIFTLENYKKIFTTLSYQTAIKNSLIITLVS
ncbi:MAG: ABC transporter permease, partial [Oscillospiraceae bacterium]|nr:ABC transporter permease [Oscillospiraceae bacterium]